MKALIPVSLAAFVLACGGSTTSNPGGGAQCNATLGGSVPGSISCGTVLVVYDSSKSQTSVGFASPATGRTQLNVVLTLTGQPRAGTYRNTDTPSGSASLDTPNGSWFFDGSQTVGSYALILNTVAPGPSSGSSTTYTVTGTFDATLPAVAGSGGSGNATVHATF